LFFHFGNFGLDAWKWFNLLAYPGIILCLVCWPASWSLYRFAQRQKWDAFEFLDFAAIAAAFGFALIWLGLFLDGTSFGNATSLPWECLFRWFFDKHHPTQLYGLISYALLFVYLYWVESRYRTFEWYRDKRHSAQTGFLFCVFCMMLWRSWCGYGFLMPPQLMGLWCGFGYSSADFTVYVRFYFIVRAGRTVV